MRKLIERRLLQYFGLGEQPMYWSEIMDSYKKDIVYAVKHNQLLTISGAVGSGKSILFSTAISTMPEVTFVYVRNYYKEHVTISSIINALIYDISDENPKRDLEARSRQFIRLVGKYYVGQGKQVCIVIEEAHRLHANTLRQLKELREADFGGKSPLFSVILIGHEELQAKLESRKEAYWRSQIMELNESNGWMTADERTEYIRHIYGNAVTSEAMLRIAGICKTPLNIDFYIENKMKEARKAGKKVLDDEVVQPTPKELYEANKNSVSIRKIAKEMQVSTTTAFDAINTENHRLSEAAAAAIAKLTIGKAM
jgi:type II secretory pathway predicted ATPase ExeA